jgi:hypothetical protein
MISRKVMIKKTKREKALVFLRHLNNVALRRAKLTNMVIPLFLTDIVG